MAKKTYKIWQRVRWPYSMSIILGDGSLTGNDLVAEIFTDAGPHNHTLAKFNTNPKNMEARRRAGIMCAALNLKSQSKSKD